MCLFGCRHQIFRHFNSRVVSFLTLLEFPKNVDHPKGFGHLLCPLLTTFMRCSFLTFRSFIEPKNSEDKHFAKHFSDLEKHSWQCGELWSENSLSLSSLSLFCCTVVTMWSVLTLKGKRKTAPEKRNPIHYTTVAILFCCSFGRRMIKKADLFSDRKCAWSMNLLINIFVVLDLHTGAKIHFLSKKNISNLMLENCEFCEKMGSKNVILVKN